MNYSGPTRDKGTDAKPTEALTLMLHRTPCGPRAAALASLLYAALAAGTAEAQMSGTWKLDEDRSDDPAEVLQKLEQRGSFGRSLRGAGGTVTIFGVQVPVQNRGQNDDAVVRPLDSAALARSGYLLSFIEKLEIVLDPKFADFKYDTLRTLTYENGEEIKTGYSTIVASWTNGNRVVVEHELIGGGEITETFTLDGRRLKWDLRVEKDGLKTIRISRVFDRAAPAASASAGQR